jgi:hypothetical protein
MEKTMADTPTKFIFRDPADLYTGGYTSQIRHPDTARGSNQRGIIQVVITDGSAEFQGKVNQNAPWITVKTYTTDAIEEAVLMPHMRIVATGTTTCKVYLSESK